jgi:hypothetical protein
MKKVQVAVVAGLLILGTLTGVSWAARAGGTFTFVVPYGGDVLTLDPHRTPNSNDWIVTMNVNRSL